MLKQMTWDEFEGLLAAKLPGFKRREIQAALAQNGLNSLSAQRHILAQAGCGTGKSFIAAFAALMMSLKTGKPAVIATATKALQDQYSEKDLPFLATIIDGLRYTVLKGRANYVCLAKVDEMKDASLKQGAQKVMDDNEDFSGEINDLGLADSTLASQFATSSEECPGKKDCPFGDVCFAERAKERAKTSHIVIANHAVLASDLMIKQMQEEIGVPEDKTSGILPKYGTVIIDEAHEFGDSVTNALGGEITAGSYGRMAKEIINWFGDSHACDGLTSATSDLFGVVGRTLANREDKRNKTLPLDARTLEALRKPIEAVVDEMAKVKKSMTLVQVHGNDQLVQRRKRLLKRIDNAAIRLQRVVVADEESLVRWLEVGEGRKGDAIGYAPLVIADFLQTTLWSKVQAMLMSATLALGNDFSYIQDELGIE